MVYAEWQCCTFTGRLGSTIFAVAVPTGVSTGSSIVGSQLFVASYSSNLPSSAHADRKMGVGVSFERAMASQCRMSGCGGAYTCGCSPVLFRVAMVGRVCQSTVSVPTSICWGFPAAAFVPAARYPVRQEKLALREWQTCVGRRVPCDISQARHSSLRLTSGRNKIFLVKGLRLTSSSDTAMLCLYQC